MGTFCGTGVETAFGDGVKAEKARLMRRNTRLVRTAWAIGIVLGIGVAVVGKVWLHL